MTNSNDQRIIPASLPGIQSSSRLKWARTAEGYGSRHVHDAMPFDLWDPSKKDFRQPEKAEWRHIWDSFQARQTSYHGGHMEIWTNSSPSPVPLTVAGMPIKFMPYSEVDDRIRQGSRSIDGFRISNIYANPRLWIHRDAKMSFVVWPTDDEVLTLINALDPEHCNVASIIFQPWVIIVSLRMDGRTHESKSLPGRFGNRTTLYHHLAEPALGSATMTDIKTINARCSHQYAGKRLRRVQDFEAGNWFSCGTGSGGTISMVAEKLRIDIPPRSEGMTTTESAALFERSVIMRVIGPVEVAPGSLYGKPITLDYDTEKADEGDIIGFFDQMDWDLCLCGGLDGNVDRSRDSTESRTLSPDNMSLVDNQLD